MGAGPDTFAPLFRSELGALVDTDKPAPPLDLTGRPPAGLLAAWRDMVLIRLAEEAIAALSEAGLARAPCHLGIGQEAVAVGVSAHLRASDRVFGGHRSHSHFLALGGAVYALIAEVLGKLDGASRGMGGSMHLLDRGIGFYGSVPLVGATIPIAVGAGLAAKMDGKGDVAVAYFGDGATEEGVFHESLNLAVTYALPVLFVCENNLFSSHLDIGLRQPSDRVARYAEAHRIPAHTIDGNDVLAVMDAARVAIERARGGGGPGFIEAVTYRHRGHVGPKDDIDVGVNRRMEDLAAWRRRDPVQRLEAAMLAAGIIKREALDEMREQLRERVAADSVRAEAAAYPPASALLDTVFVPPDAP